MKEAIRTIPSWSNSPLKIDQRDRSLSMVSQRNKLLEELVDKIKTLDGIFIPTMDRRLSDGSIVTYPGSWQYQRSKEDAEHHHFAAYSEFGNCRFISETFNLEIENDDQFDVGGHCVVPKFMYDELVEKGWALPHPFAGMSIMS
jgi:hypothetical protein